MHGAFQLTWAQVEVEKTEGMYEAGRSSQYEQASDEGYRYDPAGKRDPFSSPFNLSVSPQQPVTEPRTPLQRFELGQLKLVGVILNTEESKALIEDSKGLGYVVTPGTLIGSNGGIVKSIEPRRILVEEIEIDFYGKQQRRERELRLVTAQSAAETEDSR